MIGLMEDAVGSYELPLTVTALLTFAAVLPVWFARAQPPRTSPPSIIARPAEQQVGGAGL